MTNRQTYNLVRDNDCHWYLIPADKKQEWNDWCDLDSDDEASWNTPDFAVAIDSPSEIPFYLD